MLEAVVYVVAVGVATWLGLLCIRAMNEERGK